MMRMRVVCPADRTAAVRDALEGDVGAALVVVLPGAATAPAGDVVEADVARESVEGLVDRLRELGCERDGGIVLTQLDTVVSDAATRAEADAPGEGVDAVVWEELLARTGQDARLSVTFVAMLTIACLLGAVGAVTNSPVTVVGAMVLGPEFGCLAALAVSVVRRRARLARGAAVALLVGFAVAMTVTAGAAGLARAAGLVPDDTLDHLDQVSFIYQVGPFSLIVALLAGVAGMIALMAGESSGVLVGVFISVTTVPAAGFASVAAVLGRWGQAAGSVAQLGVNMAGIVVAGLAVLLVARCGRTAPVNRSRTRRPLGTVPSEPRRR